MNREQQAGWSYVQLATEIKIRTYFLHKSGEHLSGKSQAPHDLLFDACVGHLTTKASNTKIKRSFSSPL